MQYGHRDFERASYHFRRAYTLDPENVTAITNLGYSYAKLGRFSHAQKCFTTALDLDPENLVAKKNMSILMQPDHPVHASAYRRKHRVKPEEEIFIKYMQWGNMQIQEGNYFAALQYFEIAAVIHPDFIEPYIKAGQAYEGLNDPEKAIESYIEALQIHPGDLVASERIEICKQMMDKESPMPISIPVRIEETREMHEEAVPHVSPVPEIIPDQIPEITPKPGPPKSDDDLIQSILNQYGDLLSDSPDIPEEIKPAPQVPDVPAEKSADTSPPPKAAMKDDDIINSILQQYGSEITGSDAEQKDSDIPHTGEAPLQPGHPDNSCPPSKTNGIRVELNENQKDAMRELGNIGASHAATTLSTMLNTPIMLNVPEISIVDIDHINSQIVQEHSAMVIFTMEGQTPKAGYVILHVPKESVVQMTSIMLGLPPDPMRELNEMDESAINEIGNIMVSAFLDGTAELLGIIMLPSPPRTIFDLPKNVFKLIIDESNICFDNVVFFKTELVCDEHELTANIFMIPNPPVLNDIVRMLEEIIESSAQG